jgi:hypothetical protein
MGITSIGIWHRNDHKLGVIPAKAGIQPEMPRQPQGV